MCIRDRCLDVLRALRKEPEVRDALFTELQAARGEHAAYDRSVEWLIEVFDDAASLEARSRLVVERTALALQASLLLTSGHAAVADAFCRARLADERGYAYGTLGAEAPLRTLIDRALPAL